MSWVAVAVAGTALVGGVVSADGQRRAAHQAADAQSAAARDAIEQGDARFREMQQLLAPYTNAGNNALSQMMGLTGLSGSATQQQMIQGIQNGPVFQAMQQQGNDAILQNAAATGGLRGGNAQAALAQFSPNLLNSLINQQYNQLGGIASMGQNAAAMTGSAGMQNANQDANLLQQLGAAQAGGAAASGQYQANIGASMGQAAGLFGALYSAQRRPATTNPYTTPNAQGVYQNPTGDTYNYRGTTLPNSLRGGQW